ncbi:MAG: terpene cyclase/mutase family protein [Nitriliruptoraceae bacterium]|nr:terpene cyclase/mutase family protein [Nitriliruptoraceae bacterium]
MHGQLRRRLSALSAGLLLAAFAAPGLAAADQPLPDDRDGFVDGRFRDVGGSFGDFSSPLTQSLALLALERAADVEVPAAAIDLLRQQQCDDGGFASSFRAPTVSGGASPCSSSVDTTAFVVQALGAVGGQDDAIAAAAGWLLEAQQPDGSFASADGTNTNSTGLAALALRLAGEDAAADAAVAWVLDEQDACDAGSTGAAIPFNQDERGFVELATAQALLGVTGVSLADATLSGTDDAIPTVDCSGGGIPDGDEALAAAEWLADNISDEGFVESQFGASTGVTIDAIAAFAAVETAGDLAGTMTDAVVAQAVEYTQGASFSEPGTVFAGASAKLALGMLVAERDPRAAGDIDLIGQLLGTLASEAPGITVACDDEIAPGTDATCTVSGLLPSEVVGVEVTLNPTLFDDEITADTLGTATADFTIPDDAGDGDVIEVRVAAFGLPVAAETSVTVASTDDGAEPEPVTPVEDDETEVETREEVETGDEVEQPTRVDSGISPSGVPAAALVALASGLGLLLVLAGAVTVRRRPLR